MAEENFYSLMDALLRHQSWQLHRISPTVCPSDTLYYTRKLGGTPMTSEETAGVVALLNTGECYRCRIGQGHWHYGVQPEHAIKAALDGVVVRKENGAANG